MIDLKKEREEVGISQRELAQRMGLSFETIASKEQGRGGSPTIQWLEKWAKALGVSLNISVIK
jgi:hypothetical protein